MPPRHSTEGHEPANTAAATPIDVTPDCPFCGIVTSRIPCHAVYSDAVVVAFLDKHPINPYHVLVVPRAHVADFENLDDETYAQLMSVAKLIARALRVVATPRKVGMVIAGFDVPHAHVHVLPLHDYHDITSRRRLEGTVESPDDDELARAAANIRCVVGRA